jgi:uncharacterized RDD family membrane protein YckC
MGDLGNRAAGIERRFYSFVLDRLIGGALVVAACWAAYRLFWVDDRVWPGLVFVAAGVGAAWVAFAVVLGLGGTTPGKAALGLRVVHAETRAPIGVRLAMVRGGVLGLAAVPTLGLGLAALAWTAATDRSGRRRGWHDLVARSVVVDVRPETVMTVEADVPAGQLVNLTAMRLVPAAPAPLVPRAPRRRHPTSAVAPPRAARARWVLAFDTGEQVLVDGLVLVGRDPEAHQGEAVAHVVTLPSPDGSLSRTHAQVGVADDGALVFMDRGSTNGSMLTREGVSRPLTGGRPATLLEGDVVRFGDRAMHVSTRGASAPLDPPNPPG